MDSLTNGAITVLNGLIGAFDVAFHPLTLVVVAMGVSYAWLALIELDELDRQGTKPEIGRGQ